MFRRTSLKKLNFNNFISRRRIFSYKDPFLLEKQLTDDEKTIKDSIYLMEVLDWTFVNYF